MFPLKLYGHMRFIYKPVAEVLEYLHVQVSQSVPEPVAEVLAYLHVHIVQVSPIRCWAGAPRC